jgi:hypothetical protein
MLLRRASSTNSLTERNPSLHPALQALSASEEGVVAGSSRTLALGRAIRPAILASACRRFRERSTHLLYEVAIFFMRWLHLGEHGAYSLPGLAIEPDSGALLAEGNEPCST